MSPQEECKVTCGGAPQEKQDAIPKIRGEYWKSIQSLTTSSSEDTQESKTSQSPSVSQDWSWRSLIWPSDDSRICQTQKFKRRRRILHAVAISLVLLGTLAFSLDIKERIIAKSMEIAPGSRYLKIWQNPPVSVYMSIYAFNVTNPEEFLSGKEKLRVEEIGPFTYIEHLTHTDVMFHDNDTMSYSPRRNITFQRHLSYDDPKNVKLIIPNIVYLGLGSILAEAPMLASIGVLSPMSYLGTTAFLNLSAYDFFFGYDDPVVGMANTLLSNVVPFSKLGIIDRMYDDGPNRVSMRLKDNGLDPLDPAYQQQYSIVDWNGSPGLSVWGYSNADLYNHEELRPSPSNKCKLIQGATEGILFPRNINPKLKQYIYRKIFCRHMPVEVQKEVYFLPGVKGYWYGAPKGVFTDDFADQKCYCDPSKRKCVPRGLSDITPCYYNIPAAVSFPHFLDADPVLLENVEGLSPDRDKHTSYAVIQPDVGAVVEAKSSMQTNLVLGDMKYQKDLIRFANMVIPVVWVEMKMGELNLESIIGIYGLVIILPVTYYIILTLAVLSAIILLCSTSLFLRRKWHKNHNCVPISRNVLVAGVVNPFNGKFIPGTVPG